MSEIESPLGKQSFTSAPHQGRVLTVDDPTSKDGPSHANDGPSHNLHQHFRQPPQQFRQPLRELTPEEEAEIERQRKEATVSKNRVSATAKERIEYLTGIGRIKDNFTMDGVTFHLRSLKTGELEAVLEDMVKMGDMNQAQFNFELRGRTLARSLYSIDNMSVESVIGSDNFEDKVYFIKELDENLISYMHKFYEDKIATKGQKYTPKTEQDIKEVVESVKKQ